jgi:hypothetical protein
MTPPDLEQSLFRNNTVNLQAGRMASTRSNLSDAESRELEDLLIEYRAIVALKIIAMDGPAQCNTLQTTDTPGQSFTTQGATSSKTGESQPHTE